MTLVERLRLDVGPTGATVPRSEAVILGVVLLERHGSTRAKRAQRLCRAFGREHFTHPITSALFHAFGVGVLDGADQDVEAIERFFRAQYPGLLPDVTEALLVLLDEAHADRDCHLHVQRVRRAADLRAAQERLSGLL